MSHRSTGFSRRQRISAAVLVLALMLTMALPAVAAPAAPAALPLIDHFDVGQAPLVSTGLPATSSVNDGALDAILGDWRDLWVDYTSGTGQVSVTVNGALGTFSFNSQDQTAGDAVIQWDGTTGYTATPGSFPAPGPYNLTQGGANALSLTSLYNDLVTPVTFRVYSGPTNWCSLTVILPGGQLSGSITYLWPFAAFTTGGGTGCNFTAVSAIELVITGSGTPGADLTLHQVETGLANQDWGDLPIGYPTTFAVNGPRHSIGTLFLGTAIDSELDGQPTVGADGDDVNPPPPAPDDEDGIVRTPNVKWVPGANGGSINVTVTGGPGCLWGWIDWNGDFDFFDLGDTVMFNRLVTGSSTQTFDIPTELTPGGPAFKPGGGTFYARFRLFPTDVNGACTGSRDYVGEVTNGEVEDYRWGFGPNAVTLSGMSASSAATPLALPLGIVTFLGVLIGGIVLARRPV